MPRKGRQVPQNEDRGPRTKAMSVYFSEEEMKDLDHYALHLGFQSKSSMVVYIMEVCMKGHFGGLSFMRLARDFSDMIEKSGIGYIDVPLPKPLRERREANMKAKLEELTKQRPLEREKNRRNDTES